MRVGWFPIALVVAACRPVHPVHPDAGEPEGGGDAGPFVTAPHDAFPVMETHGEALLAPLELVTITTDGDTLEQRLVQFGNDVVGSDWWHAVATEYRFDPAATHTHVIGPALTAGTTLTDEDTKNYIRALIQDGTAPAPDNHHVYVLFLPENVSANLGGQTNPGCRVFLGYHSQLNSGFSDNRAIVQRCNNIVPLALTDVMTAVASHEIAESVTDPTGRGWLLGHRESPPWSNGGSPWSLSDEREVGDPCNRTWIAEGREVYQRIWGDSVSQTTGDPCLPLTGQPYFNVQAEHPWYGVSLGDHLTITLTGWSTARTDDWEVSTRTTEPDDMVYHWHLTSPTTRTIGGVDYNAINNGTTAQLDVTITSAHPGDVLLFELLSTRKDWALGAFTPDRFGYENSNMVGVYVQ